MQPGSVFERMSSVAEMLRNLGLDDIAESVESLPESDTKLAEAMAAFSNGEANHEQQLFLGSYFGDIIQHMHALEDELHDWKVRGDNYPTIDPEDFM